jgi:bifunctional DNase/RNase
MDLIRLKVSKLENSAAGTGAFLLHLKEEEGKSRVLPIVIGPYEAQAIIFGLEKDIATERPLTHDLFYNTLTGLGYKLKKIVIVDLQRGIFFAETVWEKDGEEFRFDSRPSDAVALAVRAGAPIYATEKVMDSAGVQTTEPEPDKKKEDFNDDVFMKMLDDFIGGSAAFNMEEFLEDISAGEIE